MSICNYICSLKKNYLSLPKTFSFNLSPVLVIAKPPKAVSLKEAGKDFPTLYIASTVSSKGILLCMPAITKSAVVKALTAPAKFLLAQGTSTKPAIGSQTRPSIFFKYYCTSI